jgi:hypothetical protein
MMQTSQNPHGHNCLRVLATVSACLLGVTAYGQATVDPETQPFHTLAPYVLKSSNLEPPPGSEQEGGTRAYRPWFESGAWTGDLIEYEVTESGVRLIRDDIGRYPRDGADWRGTSELWSARYQFLDYQWYNQLEELDANWECTEEAGYEAFWQGRNVFTLSGGFKTDFLWTELEAAQKSVLDPATPLTGDGIDDFSSPILNFIRGDRSRERCKEFGTFRWRFSVLGAIINSRPVYVPVGNDGLVVVGANDGMLHGFSAATGSELFAYIPSILMDKVGNLRISPYRPSYFVDGELRQANIGTASEPQHIVTGGLGAGGKGLFVLDVTQPATPAVMREIAGDDFPHIGGQSSDAIGHIHGRPTIARLPDNKWYVVTGNGYGSNDGTAQLLLVPLDSNNSEIIPVPTNGLTNNGLSAPSLIDSNNDGFANVAYAGDLLGNLWRFTLNPGGTSSATLLFSAGANRPITVQPDVAQHPDTLVGFMVYFGTGSLLSAADAEVTSTQAVYGIWDRGDGATVPAGSLLPQTLVTDTVTWTVPEDYNLCPSEDVTENTATVRFVANPQSPVWTGDNRNLGWQVELPRAGERLIGHPQVRAERIQFVTTNPYDMSDPARMNAPDSGSWVIQLDLASGANAKTPRALFDLNQNCTLDQGDGAPEELTISGFTIPEGTFPVGVNMGPFNIAQPAFARVRFDSTVRSVVDGVYINALQLPPPLPPADAVHGPLDVTTDSHFGPAHREVWPEPWKEPFGLREFAEASAPTKPYIRKDGIGHRVDGHSFGYNQHHGVDYVDLFDLEPQRGDWRLDIGAKYRDTDGTYKFIGPRISERELNRATEVGIDPNQRFIVMITNADLSRENEIQIGCQRWPVYEYQTMMMNILRGTDPMQALANQGLIFTLSGDYNPIRPGGEQTACAGSDVGRTLRITPTDRIGNLDATMATLPGCVNNTDLYAGSAPDTHLTRKSNQLNEDGSFSDLTPTELYLTDPHATPNREGRGFRWRNGALTVQLLAVGPDNSQAFTLQDANHLPRGNGVEGVDAGFGGAYARAFTRSGNDTVPLTDGASPPTADEPVSGMLYELSMFWHWGDMTRFQQEGTGSPVVASCYGASGNRAPQLMYETEWFTPGAYQQLTEGFTEALQQEYISLLAQLESNNPEIVEAALIALGEMFEANPNIAVYHRLRHYVPNSKQLQEHHLISIDRGGLTDLGADGTPVDVLDIERDLLPSLGPNYRPGRRSWIDLTPNE